MWRMPITPAVPVRTGGDPFAFAGKGVVSQ
jgi:hypothetical protein